MERKTGREKIAKHITNEVSPWKDEAMWRRENRDWLKISGRIAIRVLSTLKRLELSQKELADQMGVSAQHISKIVKGQENLSLQTIAKLEKALGITLVEIPEFTSRFPVVVSKGNIPTFQSAPTFTNRFELSIENPWSSVSELIDDNFQQEKRTA